FVKKNSTVFQVFTSIGTKIVILFGSFIISIILARYLGPEGKGIVTAIFVIPNLLVSIADLGIKQATAYYVGKKVFSPTKVYSSILIVWLTTSIFAITFALLYYFTGPNQTYGWSLLIIPLSTMPFLLLNKYMDGMFLGLQRVHLINIKQLLGFVINVLFVFVLVVIFESGVYGASVTTLLTAVITLLFSVFIIRKLINTKFTYEKG